MNRLVIAAGFVCLAACSREVPKPAATPAPAPAPAPKATPAPAKPGPTIVKKTEVLNEPKPGESAPHAELRALIRLEGLPCDRVTDSEHRVMDGVVTGTMTCDVGQGTQIYVVDPRGRINKR